MIYFIIFIFLLYLSINYDYYHVKNYKKTNYIIVCIILICINGLGYRLGIDSINYENAFHRLPSLSEYFSYDFSNEKWGRGYVFLNAVAKSISEEYFVLQFFHAIILNIILFWFFKKYTDHYFTAIFLYYIYYYLGFSFEIVRESLAICAFLISWKYLINKQWIKYYICILIGILFHPSCSFLLFLPFLTLKKLKFFFTIGKRTIIFGILVFLIGVVISKIFFEYILLIEISDIQNYSNAYSNTHYAQAQNLNITGYSIFLINTLYPLLGIYLLKHHHLVKNENEIANKRNFYELAICCYLYIYLLSLSISIFSRFNNYFLPICTLIIANTLYSKLRFNNIKYYFSIKSWCLLITPYLLMCLVSKMGTVEANQRLYHRYYPYKSVIFKEKDPTREKMFEIIN